MYRISMLSYPQGLLTQSYKLLPIVFRNQPSQREMYFFVMNIDANIAVTDFIPGIYHWTMSCLVAWVVDLSGKYCNSVFSNWT